MRQKNYPKRLACLAFCLLPFFISCGKKEEDAGNTEKQNNGMSGMSQELEGEGEAGTVLELKGKAFGHLDIVGKEDSVYCNLSENVTDWDTLVPICHDPLYDILYYVDYGRDYKIHAIKDGISEIVIELSGKRLFCRQGKLYFLAETRGEFALPGAKSGNILSYDPISGDITLISDQVFDSMAVFQDMIYCYQAGEKLKYSDHIVVPTFTNWFYFFHNNKLLEEEKPTPSAYQLNIQRYGEYFTASVSEQVNPEYMDENARARYEELIAAGISPERISTSIGLQLCHYDGTDDIFLENLDKSVTNSDYYVKGEDIVWLTTDNVFHTYNIPARQEITKEIKTGKSPSILLNHVIYFADGICTDLKNGTYETCEILASGDTPEIKELYTDGISLYAIVSYWSEKQWEEQLFCLDYTGLEGSNSHFFRLVAPD